MYLEVCVVQERGSGGIDDDRRSQGWIWAYGRLNQPSVATVLKVKGVSDRKNEIICTKWEQNKNITKWTSQVRTQKHD